MFTLKRIWLDRDAQAKSAWQKLLAQGDLAADETVDYTVGIYHEDQLVATGSLGGNILKCLIVCQKYQAENLLTQIIVHLLERLREEGISHYFVYTKPKNAMIFRSLGFQLIEATDEILFMEQGTPNFKSYLAMLKGYARPGNNGGIVMNANPFTKGHRYLVEQAAKACDHVYVFVLSEDRSEFSSEERMQLVKLGVADLPNVTVLPTEDYQVSSATFPSYFLKDRAQLALAKTQATLDAKIFKDKIAPVLNITQRFVGEEPFSPVTEVYNQSMQTVFADTLQLTVIPRLAVSGEIVSATKVRQALKDHCLSLLAELLPETTYNYLTENKLRGENRGN